MVLKDLEQRQDYQAIVEGRHGDPFAVLGPHKRSGSWHVTVFMPGADSVVAVQDGVDLTCQRIPDFPDLFTGPVRSDAPYSLTCTNADATWHVEDPYRFGSVLGELDEYLIAEGSQRRLWKSLGAHLVTHEGVSGVHFAVWAPNARRVSVVGDFNFWDSRRHPMRRLAPGVWDIFLPNLSEGSLYKFDILGPDGPVPQKADPVGFGSEHPPATASVVRSLDRREWADETWMESRAARHSIDAPISIYEVHLGSWRRADNGERRLSYQELATELVDYADWMGFTHLEFLPVSEYPFDGSWGYQPIGLYAPTIRHGTPDEFRILVDAAHRKGLGVLIDWVPAHFPTDAHGLGQFDGTPLYEHADPKEGFHQDWNTLIYNLGRREVSNYLISNALYWLEEYHIDGLRVDAVASMLYRDYSRDDGEWIPNIHGGRENLESIAFFKAMNTLCYGEVPGVMTVAEESTAFDGVTRPADHGGLGFGFKWNMGWMNDTLDYMQRDPIHRRHHHHQMTFGLDYAFSENYVLPISHDEVVHGKGSMIEKMPGNPWEKFANLRAYYAFMWTHPGKKLLFMGCEFAQSTEWNHDQSLAWHETHTPSNRGVQILVRDLNHMMRATPAFYRRDAKAEGFQWIDGGDAENSIFAYLRLGDPDDKRAAVILNLTPVERRSVRLGLPSAGEWREILNTDAKIYGGEDRGNFGGVVAEPVPSHGQPCSAMLTLPPLSALVFLEK